MIQFVQDAFEYFWKNSHSINSNIIDLITLVKTQNFVPVVDDDGTFIGIIKRSDVINYCAGVLIENGK